MSTVLQVISEFCDRINQPRESSIVGSTTPAARQYLSLLKQVGDDLKNKGEWAQLKRIYTFTISQGVSDYQLPGDFDRMLIGTQWGVTNQVPLSGPISNAQLAFETYGVVAASPYSSYQVNSAQGYTYNTSPYTQKSAGYFHISPPGQNSTDQNVIAYQSSNFVWPINWAPTTAYTLGSIVTGINNIYYCTVAGTSGTTRLSASSGTIIDGTCQWVVYREPYIITTDNDFCLFDDDLMIEGLRAAWFESKQQFAMADRVKGSWLNIVRSRMGRRNGNVSVNAGENQNTSLDWPPTPVSNWGPIPF